MQKGCSELGVSQIQEFSLFSCLGVTEIAPWLSDESNEGVGHHFSSSNTEISSTSAQNKSHGINSNYGLYEERIQDLEETSRRMETKLKFLEGRQKEKETLGKVKNDGLFVGNFPDPKEDKIANQNSDSKDAKSGGLSVERFRTLEGRQAFQQSKFSSLDIAFGGSTSSIWSKGKLTRH